MEIEKDKVTVEPEPRKYGAVDVYRYLGIVVPSVIGGLFILLPILLLGLQLLPWQFVLDPVSKILVSVSSPAGYVGYWLVTFLFAIIFAVMYADLENCANDPEGNLATLEKVAYGFGALALIMTFTGSFWVMSYAEMFPLAGIKTFFGIQTAIAIMLSGLLKVCAVFMILMTAAGLFRPNHW